MVRIHLDFLYFCNPKYSYLGGIDDSSSIYTGNSFISTGKEKESDCMTQYDYHAIDDLIHSRIRLSILALLVTRIKASFTEIKNQVGASDGNLSIHIRKLEQAEYVSVNKKFINRKPLSMYTITDKGRSAFNHYIEHIESLLKIGELQ